MLESASRTDAMIIFNLWAVPVGMVIYMVLFSIEIIFPALVTGPRFGWTLGIVTTVMGGLCELAGARGRLFLMPIWMIGVGIICFYLGWPGTLAFVVAVIGGAVVFFQKGKKKEILDWDVAQLAMIKAPAAPVDGTEKQFWDWIQKSLFLPVWMKFTAELCQHNLVVLAALKDPHAALSKEQMQQVDALIKFLEAAKASPKPVGSEVKLQQTVCDLVRKKARNADSKKRFRKEVEPPRLPVSRQPEKAIPARSPNPSKV